ncbi:MAG: hypothetical protein K9L75_02300 [Spirochaetia bacterium]|nr:hypothetical protein [Spirochaetia bacterium]
MSWEEGFRSTPNGVVKETMFVSKAKKVPPIYPGGSIITLRMPMENKFDPIKEKLNDTFLTIIIIVFFQIQYYITKDVSPDTRTNIIYTILFFENINYIQIANWINVYIGLCIALVTGLIFFVINFDREEINIAKGYLIENTNIIEIIIYLISMMIIRLLDLVLLEFQIFFSSFIILIIPVIIIVYILKAYIVMVSIVVSSENRIKLRNKYVRNKFLNSLDPSENDPFRFCYYDKFLECIESDRFGEFQEYTDDPFWSYPYIYFSYYEDAVEKNVNSETSENQRQFRWHYQIIRDIFLKSLDKHQELIPVTILEKVIDISLRIISIRKAIIFDLYLNLMYVPLKRKLNLQQLKDDPFYSYYLLRIKEFIYFKIAKLITPEIVNEETQTSFFEKIFLSVFVDYRDILLYQYNEKNIDVFIEIHTNFYEILIMETGLYSQYIEKILYKYDFITLDPKSFFFCSQYFKQLLLSFSLGAWILRSIEKKGAEIDQTPFLQNLVDRFKKQPLDRLTYIFKESLDKSENLFNWNLLQLRETRDLESTCMELNRYIVEFFAIVICNAEKIGKQRISEVFTQDKNFCLQISSNLQKIKEYINSSKVRFSRIEENKLTNNVETLTKYFNDINTSYKQRAYEKLKEAEIDKNFFLQLQERITEKLRNVQTEVVDFYVSNLENTRIAEKGETVKEHFRVDDYKESLIDPINDKLENDAIKISRSIKLYFLNMILESILKTSALTIKHEDLSTQISKDKEFVLLCSESFRKKIYDKDIGYKVNYRSQNSEKYTEFSKALKYIGYFDIEKNTIPIWGSSEVLDKNHYDYLLFEKRKFIDYCSSWILKKSIGITNIHDECDPEKYSVLTVYDVCFSYINPESAKIEYLRFEEPPA